MQLPFDLTKALTGLLEGVPRGELVAAAARMSEGYRQGATSQGLSTQADVIAYAVARMPATFAACGAVFARMLERMPEFVPQSLLDVGAGTGAASWAAVAIWPGIAATMLDRNPALCDLARRLAHAGPLARAQILAGDIADPKPKADLVAASYVLAELPEEQAGVLAVDLWQSAKVVLALVEPGTPAGFDRIRAARTALIAAGAHILAPCTHANDCPMKDGDWCHFSQRLPRSRDHMLLKEAHVPFEDERYSYLVVTHEKSAAGARILAPPLEEKPGLTFKLCEAKGLRAQFVPVRDKEEYRRVRKLGWGDLF